MPRRWKETSFVGASRTTKVRVPFDVELEDAYENVHRSMGDLRPSRSHGNSDPYYSPSRRDRAPFAGSMGVIPAPGTEVTVTESKEIGIVEGNRRIPLASFQRDVVMAQNNNMSRAESMSTFTSSGMARNTNAAGVLSFASGWHEQRVVVDSERETSIIAMRTTASSSKIHYPEGSHNNKPVHDDEFLKGDYKMHIYGDTSDLCQPYGFSNYPDNDSFKPPLDIHHPDLYHHDHIYDEIQESDKVDQHNCDPYSGENLYENVRKPVIINERLKKPGVTDGGNYENVRSFASSENRVHQSSSFRNDIERAAVINKHKAQVFQPISGCKSTPNLTTFPGSNQQLISEGNMSVENVNDHSEETLDSDRRDAKRSTVEEKVQVPYTKKPYLETNLDDILWLPTPIKSDSSVKQLDDSTAVNKITSASSETELTAKPSAEYTSFDEKISIQTETAPTTLTCDEYLSLSVLGIAKPEVTDQNGKSEGSNEWAMVKDPTTTISDEILSPSVPDIPKPKETDQNDKIEDPNEFAVVNDKDFGSSVKPVPATHPAENQYVADDKDVMTSEVAEISFRPNGENLSPSVPDMANPEETDHNNKSGVSDDCVVVSDITTVFDENLSSSVSGIPKPKETDHNGKLGGSVECAVVNDKHFGISVKPVPTIDPTENQYVAGDKDRRTSEVAELSSRHTDESLTTTSFLKIETTAEQFKESFPVEKDSDIAMVTKGTTEEVKRNVSNVHKNSIKASLMNETHKSRTSKKSVKRPSCPPPPPPSKTESSLVPKEPGVATPETDIPVSPSPDPAESTLNLGFISDEKAILPGDQENNEVKHSSEAFPLDYVDRDNEARCVSHQRYVEGCKKDMKDEGNVRYKNTLLEKEQNSFQGETLVENKIMSETVLQENSDDKIELTDVNSVSKEYKKEKTVESHMYDSASKTKFSVMQLSNQKVNGESKQSPNISDFDIEGEELPGELTSDFDTVSETLVDQLPDDVTFEETDPKEPPPYTPPPPPPKSESSESLSVASAEESRPDLESHRSPSPPPRPPSPLAYTGPSTPPLYFSSPLPDLEGTTVLEGQINPSPLPSTEESASVTQRNLLHETDLRRSPSPPPIPPRPKHIGKFFYHPTPSLDFQKHVYENLLYSQGKGDHIGGTQSFRNDIYAEAEGGQACNQYEILYENINNLQIQRDSLGNRAKSKTDDKECIYENLRGSAIRNDTLTNPEEQECIYENVKSLKDMSDKVAGINRVSSPRAQTYDEYSDTYEENILGHTYETINKSRSKNQVRDHIYDIIRTDESEIGGHRARNKSQNHERTVEYDDSYLGYLYATVNKTKSVDKKNTSSSESSILNHTYAVIDRSQTEDSLFHKEDHPEEIYENIPPRNISRNQDESRKRELFQDDCIYENLGVSRKSLRDHQLESTGYNSDATVVSSASLHCDSLAYSREERAGTPEDRPPTPPPRHLPGVTGIPFRPTYSPPPPPIPPFNPEAYLQAEEQRFLTSFNSASSHRQLGRESEDIEKELSFDYQREVQEFLHLQKQRRRWHKERRRCQPQQQMESGNRAMMEFYVNNLTSDSDSDNDSSAGSSTSASGGSHDLEEEVVEHQQQMLDRTYQVIGGADTVLDTIEEDVEEDSGAESSGHWMFSADNTDTDSVIHVPAILDLRPYPVEAVRESESTDSDGTVVTEDDVTQTLCCPEVASNSRQEAGVTEGNSQVEEAQATRYPHPHPGSSASDEEEGEEEEEDEENDDSDLGSRGVEPVTAGGGRVGSPTYRSSDAVAKFHNGIRGRTERDSNGGVYAGDCKGRGGLPRQDKETTTMLSRTEATRQFEKRIDDVFDFESLESCESVYGGHDSTGYPLQGCVSPLAGEEEEEEEEVVFNTSATSQPFADASGEVEGEVTHGEVDEDGLNVKDAGRFSLDQMAELSSKETRREGSGSLPTTPSSHGVTPVQIKQDDALGESRGDCSFSELDSIANGGQCNLDQTYVIGNSDGGFIRTEITLTENDGKEGQRARDGEPLSMDLFGLPVRWTEGEKKGSGEEDLTCVETPVAPSTCLAREVVRTNNSEENCEDLKCGRVDDNDDECDELKYDSDTKYDKTCDEEIRSLTESLILKEGERASSDRDASENEIATENERAVSPTVSEGDFTFSSVSTPPRLALGETSAVEARHYQTATGNLLKTSTDPELLSVIAGAEGEGGGPQLLLLRSIASPDRNGIVDSASNMRETNSLSTTKVEHRANYHHYQQSPPFVEALRHGSRQTTTGGQPQLVKTTRHLENFSYYEGNVDARCLDYDKQQYPGNVGRDVKNGRPLGGGGGGGGDLPSGDSDADTDNTDGDYDEEDHFAAELSLRISTVHPEVNRKGRGKDCTSYRNSDILNALTSCRGEKRGEEEEGAGHGDAPGSVSPLASQDGSSPEMPDSLRSSEGRSATRSIETLSEDSGLGDRDVRLTPSSPLPSISEGATRGVPVVVSASSSTARGTQQQLLTSVTARPKRQDIRQARIARARSCGDLRAHSASSDTDTEEDSNMRGWHSRLRGREGGSSGVTTDEGVHNGGMHHDRPFKSSYANYLQQQYHVEGAGDGRNPPSHLRSQPPAPSSRYQHQNTPGSHPLSESDGSDKEVKSKYRRVREASSNHSRPRRYKSLLEFPNSSEYYNDNERVPRAPHTHTRSSRRRPQPISVDLAEEFLSQERLGTTDQNIVGTIRINDDKLTVNKNTPLAAGKGVGIETASSFCPIPSTNQMPHGELQTNGVEVGGASPPPGSTKGSRGEDEGLAKRQDEASADVRVQCVWPPAPAADSAASPPTAPYPHPHHPLDALHHHHQQQQQLSCTPPVPSHTPSHPPSQRQTHHQYSSSSSSSAQLPNECQPVRTSQSGGDVAIHDPSAPCDPGVYSSSSSPSSSSSSLASNQQQNSHQSLHQQPSFVVSGKPSNAQIPRAEGGEVMEEVPITRVRTKTYGSHGEVEVYLAKADSGRPPPHPGPQPVLTPTGGLENRTGSRGVTFSPSVKEVNWRESYYDAEPEGEDVSDSVKSSGASEVKTKEKYAVKTPVPPLVAVMQQQQQQEVVRPPQGASVPTMQTSNDHATSKLNGGSIEPSTGSSSEAEAYDERGHPLQQKNPSGPIWQRFKLPKISSPKSPRPKIMPKPKSLSPRSSDAENSKSTTPTPHESGSSTPSSPDSKLKKAPPSPKFFTWGSKREKKPREITRPKTPPPPVPRSSPPPPPPSPSPLPTQVSSGQVVGGQGGEAGKLDSPSSVTLTGFHREGRSDASPVIVSVKKREVVASDSNRDDVRIAPALLIAKRQQLRKSEPPAVTSSTSSSYYNSTGTSSSGSGGGTRDKDQGEEGRRDSRSRSVSSSGDDSGDARGTSPSSRSAVAKPPLPPPHLQRPTQQAFQKARLLSARRHYFSQERQTTSAPERVSPPKDNKDETDALEGAVSTPARPPVTPPPTPPVSSYRHTTSPSGTSGFSSPASRDALPTKGSFDTSKNLKERLARFSASTRAERERLARSTPDLSVLIESVRRPNGRIDSCTGGGGAEAAAAAAAAAEDIHVAAAAASQAWASDGETSNPAHAHQGASHTQSKPRQAIHERYKNRAQRIYARSRTQSTGVLETDLDTGASRELLTLRETNLDDLYKDLHHLLDSIPFGGAPTPTESKARAKSLLDLEAAGSAMEGQLEAPARPPDTRAKSMEFLLDDGNKAAVQPPENELMKGSERQLSEAELRVRRSLQRLDVPEWMKNAQPQQTGFLLRRRDYGSSSGGGGWSAYSSKTASMTSLGSSRAHTPNTPTKVVIPTRVASKATTGIGGVTSPASNASISPSPSDRSGSLFQYPISRWSTSRLNSGTTTPTGSVTSTRTTPPTYVRQPYLGWRSQTSLASLAGSQSSLTNTGSYLTAADRLALGITSYSQRFVKPSVSAQDKENSSAQANAVVTKSDNEEMKEDASTNGSVKLQVPTDVADVHSSIKEVTSAIVHYCNESTPSPRASPRGSPRPEGPRAPSPRRLVWVESSFVGSRPITSPETPTSSTHAITPTSQLNGHEEPESNEAPSQPPQPPGEYLLAW